MSATHELHALVELLLMLLRSPRTAGVMFALLLAAVSDCRTYRIPNWLTFGGTAFALLYSVLVPFSARLGWAWSLGGLALGLLLTLPWYALRMTGAGDVKLMAMVGAFLGAGDVVYAALYSFVVGGLAALVSALLKQRLALLLRNVQTMGSGAVRSLAGVPPEGVLLKPQLSVGKLPFGVCIAIGTMSYVVAKQLDWVA